jgi:TfoX/Sxy family transcriptional regulator of competence genes
MRDDGADRRQGVITVQIPRPTDTDKLRFRELVPDDPRVVIKPMFGNLGAFVEGNMFMGLFGSDIGVKLGPDDQERVRAAGGTAFGPPERPMSGYLTLPVTATPDLWQEWISSALAHVAEQPPKRPKARS